MPYKLTPQAETKELRPRFGGEFSAYEYVRTPEEKVRAAMWSIGTGEIFAERAAAILEDPEAPKLPVSMDELDAATQEKYGYKFEEVSPYAQDVILDKFLTEQQLSEYANAKADFVQQKMGETLLPDGKTIDETMNALASDALSQLQELAQASPVSLTMPASRLGKLFGDERYKTVFEVSSPGKGSARSAYIEARLETETRLGVPEEVEPENRPVYATLGGGGTEYGDVTVTLDDSVKDRTTVSIGDSLDGHVSAYLNMGDLAEGRLSNSDFWSAAGDRIADWAGNDHVSHWFSYDNYRITGYVGIPDVRAVGDYHYVEAQIHGGVSLSDVTAITVNPDLKISNANQTKLDSLGITVNRVQSTWTKD